MTPHLADDYPAIKERMEQIEAERLSIKPDETPEPKTIDPQTYMGWDIYAPVTLNNVNG